jgi:hypothetical protein
MFERIPVTTPIQVTAGISYGSFGINLLFSTTEIDPGVVYGQIPPIFQLVYDVTLVTYDDTILSDVQTYIGEKQEFDSDFNLWDSTQIPMSEFVAVGTPSPDITSIGISGGQLWLDGLQFGRIVPKREYQEAQDDPSVKRYGKHFLDRRSDNFTTAAQAYAYAKGYVARYGKPRETYALDVPLTTPLSITDTAITPNGDIVPISAITYDFNQGMMHLAVGAPESTLNARLQQQAEHADRIERRLT